MDVIQGKLLHGPRVILHPAAMHVCCSVLCPSLTFNALLHYNYRSLAKERPWAEHLNKSGVGVLSWKVNYYITFVNLP